MSADHDYVQLANLSVSNEKQPVQITEESKEVKPKVIMLKTKNFSEAIKEIKNQLDSAPDGVQQKAVSEIKDDKFQMLTQSWNEKDEELCERIGKGNIEKIMKENEINNFISMLERN